MGNSTLISSVACLKSVVAETEVRSRHTGGDRQAVDERTGRGCGFLFLKVLESWLALGEHVSLKPVGQARDIKPGGSVV